MRCILPRPLSLHVRNVSMVRCRFLFSVEAMHNGERVPRLQCWYLGLCCWREMTISYLVGGILADRSLVPRRSVIGTRLRRSLLLWMNLAYCLTVTGVWKAVRTPEIPLQTPLLARRLCVRLPVQNLTLKFRRLKFSRFLFSYLEASYGIIRKLAPYENFPLYGIQIQQTLYARIVNSLPVRWTMATTKTETTHEPNYSLARA